MLIGWYCVDRFRPCVLTCFVEVGRERVEGVAAVKIASILLDWFGLMLGRVLEGRAWLP